MPELNLGQMVREVERAAGGQGQDHPGAARRRQRASIPKTFLKAIVEASPMSTLSITDQSGRTVPAHRTACRTSGARAAASAPRSTASRAR